MMTQANTELQTLLDVSTIKTVKDFSQRYLELSWYYPGERIQLCQRLKYKWQGITQSADDFVKIHDELRSSYASPEEFFSLYGGLLYKWPDLVTSAESFCSVYYELLHVKMALLPRLCLIQDMHCKWNDYIKSGENFFNVYCLLNEAEQIILCDSVKHRWRELINTASLFLKIYNVLNNVPQQQTFFYESLKELLPDFINNEIELDLILKALPPARQQTVCRALLKRLPAIIQSLGNVNLIFRHLTLRQTVILIFDEGFKEKLPGLFHQLDQLTPLLDQLATQHCEVIVHCLLNKIIGMITNWDDFKKIMRHLTLKQFSIVCHSLKEKLFDHIQTIEQAWKIFNDLTAKQSLVVGHVLQGKLLALLNTADDYHKLLYPRRADLSIAFAIYHCVEVKAFCVIESVDDFNKIACLCTAQQRNRLYAQFKTKWSDCVNNADEFRRLLLILDMDQCEEAFHFFLHRLPQMIHTLEDYEDIFRPLIPEQRTVLFPLIKDKLPEIVITCHDLHETLSYLTATEKLEACESLLSSTHMQGKDAVLFECAKILARSNRLAVSTLRMNSIFPDVPFNPIKDCSAPAPVRQGFVPS